MKNNKIYIKKYIVNKNHIDFNNHVSNIIYLTWMQELSIKHSQKFGWNIKKQKELGFTFFIKNHYINYINQAYMKDTIIAKTWIKKINFASFIRRFIFLKYDNILVESESKFIYININTNKISLIPQKYKKLLI